MIFAVGTLISFIFILIALFLVIRGIAEESIGTLITGGVLLLLFLVVGYWTQTHRSVPVNHVGVARNSISQELSSVQRAGLVNKPFFGSVHNFPASNSTEMCSQYTPSLKGSYGITVDVCFYIDTANVDWKREIQETGSLQADQIMNVWRNGVVADVAKTFKGYTPEALSANRAAAEASIYENTNAWFAERGIDLVRVSFTNWDFTSPEVGANFDQSILAQRKITEQNALLEAAKISREREVFEVETDRLVAEQNRNVCDTLDITGEECNMYLLINLYEELEQIPDTMIITGSGDVPIAVSP